jgi:hypothetical protein
LAEARAHILDGLWTWPDVMTLLLGYHVLDLAGVFHAIR